MKALVVANWKMNPPTFREAKKLLDDTKKASEKHGVSVVVAPPSIFIRELSAKSRGKRVTFAFQHAHADESGAHTGEISIAQAHDAKVSYVLIGHAERRAQGESNADTRKKVVVACALGLTPILCVGEIERGQGGEYFNYIAEQLKTALSDLSPSHLVRTLIVYEPLWTIGTDRSMSPHDMHQMSIFIRKTIVDMYGDIGHKMKILYGGSLNAANTGAMLREGDVHGLLVGRASIDAVEFGHLLQAVASA